MKTKILILMICCTILACKNESKDKVQQIDGIEQKEEPNKLIFEVDLTTTQPDEFKLFANNVFLNNNQFMNLSIGQKLNMNETSKKMTYEFPDNIKPDVQLGFLLGTKFEKEIQFRSMSLSYGKTMFDIKPEELNDYFTTNKFVKFDSISKKLSTQKIEGKHNPMIFVRRKILDSIQNID